MNGSTPSIQHRHMHTTASPYACIPADVRRGEPGPQTDSGRVDQGTNAQFRMFQAPSVYTVLAWLVMAWARGRIRRLRPRACSLREQKTRRLEP